MNGRSKALGEAEILKIARELESRIRTGPGINAAFVGWDAWAAVHLPSPGSTMRVFEQMDRFAWSQRALTIFAIHAINKGMQARAETPNLFSAGWFIRYLDSSGREIGYKNKLDSALKPVQKGHVYVIQITNIFPDGRASSSISIFAAGSTVLEFFYPFDDVTGSMQRALRAVVDFLKVGWLPNVTLSVQRFPWGIFHPRSRSDRVLLGQNFWNIYFLFLRSRRNFRQCSEMMSEMSRRNPELLFQRRDLLIQTAGRLIASCAKKMDPSPDSRFYLASFAETSPPRLTDEKYIQGMVKVFLACSDQTDPLWNVLDSISSEGLLAGQITIQGRPESPPLNSSFNNRWPSDPETMRKWGNFIEIPGSPPMKFSS